MSKVIRNTVSKLFARREHGAIAPLFAILLAGGALIATIGLVVDFGHVYIEKRVVQNAADNVADAIAQHCSNAASGVDCLTDDYTTVNTLGVTTATQTAALFLERVANPAGGANVSVTHVCGVSTTPHGIPACEALNPANPNECKVDLANASPTDPRPNFIRVYVQSTPSQPFFATFSLDNQQLYYETACAQTYWGVAGSITTNANTLPVMIGMCEIAVNTSSNVVGITGDANESSCSVTDRESHNFTANGRGWRRFDPTAISKACWTLNLGGCDNVALATTPTSTYQSTINNMLLNIDKNTLVPIYDKVNGKFKIRAFANFKLLAFRFPTATGISAPVYPTSNTSALLASSGTRTFTVPSFGSLKVNDTIIVRPTAPASLVNSWMTGKVTATTTTVVGSTITKKITFSITGTSGSSTTTVTAWSIAETTSGNTCNNIGSSSSSSSNVYCIWGEYQNRVKSHSEDDDNHSEEHVKLADESSEDVPDFGYILIKHER